MAVHLSGRMVRVDEVVAIANKYNLLVIEDAAQSIGSKYKGKKSGSYGDVGCFSTHPLKNLNAAGDGGFLVTDNLEVVTKVKQLRNHGHLDRSTVGSFGMVSRMDEMQAAILIYRFKHLDDIIQRRRRNAFRYQENLNNKHVYFPKDGEEYFNTFHTFVIQVENRDKLVQFLKENGVQTAIHYPVPIHLQPASANLGYKMGDFVMTESQANRILTLPVNQNLTDGEVQYIYEKVNQFFEVKS